MDKRWWTSDVKQRLSFVHTRSTNQRNFSPCWELEQKKILLLNGFWLARFCIHGKRFFGFVIRELKIQTFTGRRRRGDVRSVGLPSRWKRELILFVFLIYCQFCQLYSSDCIITFLTNHPTMSRPTQEIFCFLFRSKWPKQHVLQRSANWPSKFWAFKV